MLDLMLDLMLEQQFEHFGVAGLRVLMKYAHPAAVLHASIRTSFDQG
jgi:hypothetical protein